MTHKLWNSRPPTELMSVSKCPESIFCLIKWDGYFGGLCPMLKIHVQRVDAANLIKQPIVNQDSNLPHLTGIQRDKLKHRRLIEELLLTESV